MTMQSRPVGDGCVHASDYLPFTRILVSAIAGLAAARKGIAQRERQ